jgi:hypothetical protein
MGLSETRILSSRHVECLEIAKSSFTKLSRLFHRRAFSAAVFSAIASGVTATAWRASVTLGPPGRALRQTNPSDLQSVRYLGNDCRNLLQTIILWLYATFLKISPGTASFASPFIKGIERVPTPATKTADGTDNLFDVRYC